MTYAKVGDRAQVLPKGHKYVIAWREDPMPVHVVKDDRTPVPTQRHGRTFNLLPGRTADALCGLSITTGEGERWGSTPKISDWPDDAIGEICSVCTARLPHG